MMDSPTKVIMAERSKPLRVLANTSPERMRELECIRTRRTGFATSTSQQRLLDALATGPVSVIEAERHLGIRNPPDIVMRLRRDCDVLVISERVKYADEDGNLRPSAVYWLPAE